MPLPDGRPNACRLLIRYNLPLKNQLCLIKKAVAPGPGSSLEVYEVDPLECPHGPSPMKVIAVITEPEKVGKILGHLVKIGRSPPGFDPTSLN